MKPRRSNVPSLVVVFSSSATTGGTLYAFGMYAEALKQTLSLSQSELNTISAAMFIAGLFSWIPGLIVDRFGTRFSLCGGGLMGAVSTLSYWAVARQFIAIQSVVVVLSVLGMLVCLSCAMIVGSVFKVILVSCGQGSKGVAVGIAKAYVGLGAGVFTCIFQAIRSPGESPLDFLPMSAFFFFVLAFLPGIVFLPTQEQVKNESIVDDATPLHFRTLYMSLLLLAVIVIGSSISDLLEETDSENVMIIDQKTSIRRYIRAAFILTVWLGPFVSLLFMNSREKTLGGNSLSKRNKMDGNAYDSIDSIADALFLASPLASSDNMLKAFCSTPELGRKPSTIVSSSENMFGMLSPRQNSRDRFLPTGTSGSAPALFIPPRTHFESQISRIDEDDAESHEDTFLLADIEGDQGSYTVPPSSPPPPPPPPQHKARKDGLYDSEDHNYTLVQLLHTPMSWLMLWTCTIVVGSGTLQVNNMGEMVASRGFSEKVGPACLALFSVSQATARVVTGAVSEAALHWKAQYCPCFARHGIPRPFFLVVASALACLAHFVISFGNVLPVFVIGSVLSGIAFGMVWPLMVLIIGEVFGLDNHGANYMFYDGFTLAVGTLALSKFLAGSLYDAHLDKTADDPYTCVGAGCFRTTHLVVSGLALSCVITGIIFEYCSRPAYEHQLQQYGR